jgi:porphobilinogen synthase
MSYSTKFASSFYGPFREAAGTALKGDRKTYQMSPMNRREAIRESLLDEAQGADCLMVKPAGAYLDILRDIRERSDLPLGAYQVSGEYAMIKFAAQAGAIDEEKVVLESLGAIKRAGADLIFSYFALDLAEKKSSVKPPSPGGADAYRGYQTSSPVRCIYRDHHTVARIRRLRRYPGTGAKQYL